MLIHNQMSSKPGFEVYTFVNTEAENLLLQQIDDQGLVDVTLYCQYGKELRPGRI